MLYSLTSRPKSGLFEAAPAESLNTTIRFSGLNLFLAIDAKCASGDLLFLCAKRFKDNGPYRPFCALFFIKALAIY